ncbi:VacJ family lipoprotein [Pseudomonas sp. RIT-PI-AD]|uniref:MlaA family lipoprotein n=1 Tax=Pseudomonas sp. RIT-PI-AD TaxID=3035294 RepID=UPI0021DAE839|nr:VacJ family lipoprotein [Pseudomonas sp. RIT-PI-AD]
MRKRIAHWSGRVGRLALYACLSSLPALAQAADEDPWEGVNRAIFRFNDTLDTYALKPVAKGYQAITPQFLEDGIHNVFGNVGDVGNLANNLLQAKFHDAGVDSSRLIFNSTFGLLGFFDVATHMGLRKSDEDFGQTLGYWGLGSGPYLVLPLLGPSTVRDAGGLIPESFFGPYPYMDHVPTRNLTRGVEAVDTRASLLSAEKMITGDKYVFLRNAYLQNREYRVKDGQVEDDF